MDCQAYHHLASLPRALWCLGKLIHWEGEMQPTTPFMVSSVMYIICEVDV